MSLKQAVLCTQPKFTLTKPTVVQRENITKHNIIKKLAMVQLVWMVSEQSALILNTAYTASLCLYDL